MNENPAPIDESKSVDIGQLIQVAILISKAVPAVFEAIAAWKTKNDSDPTVENIKAIMDGTRPPSEY
jgi:Na+-translocating ferredoxin:NAD+ oxidoreductase RNF subunit RnfB